MYHFIFLRIIDLFLPGCKYIQQICFSKIYISIAPLDWGVILNMALTYQISRFLLYKTNV